MEITKRIITYNDIKNTIPHIEGDKYGIAAYFNEHRRKTFLNNPNLSDFNKDVMSLYCVDGIVAGRGMSFESKFKCGDAIYPSAGGSALEVYESYRKYALGADIIVDGTLSKEYSYNIFAGISSLALPLYKKLKYTIFEFPRMMQLINSKSIIASYGIKGVLLEVISYLINIPLRVLRWVNECKTRPLLKKFIIKREIKVPEWVNQMTLDDKYKYMEVHDREWLQWNLDYNFHGNPQDIQCFYGIYLNDNPIGFFMTKERFKPKAGGKLKNIMIGSIVEWGSCNESILTEQDIYKIALTTFSKNLDIVEFATTDNKVVKTMKKWGFIQHGFAHIVFKDKTKKIKDSDDINLWRIRYGYADVILT